jgi:diguanylate cyclase (GGDEF)-like protein
LITVDGPANLLARRSLDRIASAAAAMLDVPLVLISVLDGPRQIDVGSHGVPEMFANEPSPLCREVGITGRPIVLQDARRRLPTSTHRLGGFELVGYAGVALKLAVPSRIGTLAVFSPVRRAWQNHDLDLLRCLAEAAAAILDMHAGCEQVIIEQRGAANEVKIALATNKRRTLEIEATAIHDELTGLLNRRGLFAVASAQLDAVCQHTIGGVLLYVDLDNLKMTNDRYGHSAGDDLLRSAAGALRASFRDTDTIARLGGDEFVVVAADTPREDHPAVLARLATELGRVNQHRDPRIPLTWSLGLVSIEPATVVSLDKLMSTADRRMYAAKRAPQDTIAARRSLRA